MTSRILLASLMAGSIVFVALAGTAVAVETIYVGTAYRTGSASDGFPEFLKVGTTDATTRAWNLFGSDQILNGVTVYGTGGGSTGTGGLTIFDNPNTYTGSLDFSGDPQQAAKNDIANKGRWSGSSGWSVNITATPGATYDVEVMSNPINGGNQRTLDVTVDGTLFDDNLYVPVGPYYSVVHKFPVTADADGIDITFGPGDEFDTNPWVTAIAVTGEAPAPPPPEPSPEAIDLADILGGGDGSWPGTGNVTNTGIDAASGNLVSTDGGGDHSPANAGDYYPVALDAVDGTFVPNGTIGPQQIDSAGHTYDFAGVADANVSWGHMINGKGPIDDPSDMGGDTENFTGDPLHHSMISMHAQKGVTFDLDAIEAANGGVQAERFTAIAGESRRKGGPGSLDYLVFLDGQLMTTGYVADSEGLVDISIDPDSRFLTLVMTNHANSNNSDHGYYGDPFLWTTASAAIPEPSTFALAALGLLGLGFIGWRRQRK